VGHEAPRIDKLADSVQSLMEEVKSAPLSGAEALHLLHVAESSARQNASEISKQLKQEHGPELFDVLTEVLSWYRSRTKPEMPFQLQDRALDVLWRAKGKPTSGNILNP
jgi:hypothetical protein